MFGFQQKLIPNYISPDDMVMVYKSLLREHTELLQKNRKSDDSQNRLFGMIDYDHFLKGLVRICLHAQEKLGGVDKDLLQQSLDKETEKQKMLDE